MKPQITQTDEHLLLNGLPLYIYSGNHVYFDPNEILVMGTDCGYTFEVKNTKPVTLVVPCAKRQIIVGDNYNYVDNRAVSKYYCLGPTDILKHDKMEQIHTSIFHLIEEDALSFSVFGESVISVFHHEYEQYVSITGIPHESKIVFYLDVAENYKINLQRQNIHKREIRYIDCLDYPDICSAIYHGSKLIHQDTNIENVINTICDLQNLFFDEKLYSAIIGSTAEALNGIPCLIHDYDFMFKNWPSVVHASEILKMCGWEILETNNKSISMQKIGELKVDLVEDNYGMFKFPVNVREAGGLRFLDVQGLMWLALLNRQEFDRTLYKYPKNDKALFRLSLYANRTGLLCNTKIGPELLELVKYTEKCKEIVNILSESKLLFKDTRINFPFKINCFEYGDIRILPIINTGSVADARIVTDMKPNFAQWEDVSGKMQEAKVEINDDFSLIYLTNIDLPGILRCRTEAK